MKLVKNENEKNLENKVSEEEAEQAFVKIINAKEIKIKFEEKEKKFDPDKVYKGKPNPTKI